MHAALPPCDWRTPPGRAALRDELRRIEVRDMPAGAEFSVAKAPPELPRMR
jgi:hypothetical protein